MTVELDADTVAELRAIFDAAESVNVADEAHGAFERRMLELADGAEGWRDALPTTTAGLRQLRRQLRAVAADAERVRRAYAALMANIDDLHGAADGVLRSTED